MNLKKLSILVLGLTLSLGAVACTPAGPGNAPVENPPSDGAPVNPGTGGETPGNTGGSEVTMPAGAKPGSAEFPFPVPESWPEMEPFRLGTTGKKESWDAIFVYPDADKAQEAAEHYRALLTSAGYRIDNNPLGEVVHLASFIVQGPVDGVMYSGSINFDTDAGGTARAIINLVVQNN